jgi:hypothetical protein
MLRAMDEPVRKRVVVTRPEPPSDDAPAPRKEQLTHEEMRALLTVAKTNRPPWGRVARRVGLGVLPTAVLGVVLDAWLGWWATPVLVVILVVWAAWPLVRQDRDGWA